jgi:HK97 family phage major capsid protein
LQLAAGGNTSQNLADGGLPKYLGYPVVEVNALNGTLTAQVSTNLLCLGDLRMATVFGDRRKMTLSTTDQRYWDEDQMAIKATERFDFNCHSTGNATEAGAVVVLATPGA